MSESCEHIGAEHPMYFQCANCDDTADQCNCNVCGMVFCEKCQEMIFVECDTVTVAWMQKHPNEDMVLARLMIEGVIKDYHSSASTVRNQDE